MEFVHNGEYLDLQRQCRRSPNSRGVTQSLSTGAHRLGLPLSIELEFGPPMRSTASPLIDPVKVGNVRASTSSPRCIHLRTLVARASPTILGTFFRPAYRFRIVLRHSAKRDRHEMNRLVPGKSGYPKLIHCRKAPSIPLTGWPASSTLGFSW